MNISYKKQLKTLLARPLFTAADAKSMGIHPSNVNYYIKLNLIERIGRGVYRGIGSAVNTDFQWEELVLIANSVPNGVICLISALSIYNLTDELPRQHWIAIPHSTTSPKRNKARFIRMRDTETGKTRYKLGKEVITIFNQERTIVDAFRYLSKEIAIKALKKAVNRKKQEKFNLNRLQNYARKFRLNLEPYILTVTT